MIMKQMTEQGIQGEKGEKGDPGVAIGTEMPTDLEGIDVFILENGEYDSSLTDSDIDKMMELIFKDEI